jgi:hypothetical protein
VRFVFTQCYSGAFARLAEGHHNRCGFMAEAADREAEGCSASLETGDYRDYSTFFFSALIGQTRTGDPLAASPDLDGNGEVSLREAHLYTLRSSFSTDLPRATSEAYLESWLPWYLGWTRWSPRAHGDGPYGSLARDLAEEAGIGSHGALGSRLRERSHALELEHRELLATQDQNQASIDRLREALEDELFQRWPEAAYPYTGNYVRFLREELDAAQTFITAHPSYPDLVRKQDAYWEQEERLLHLERALTHLDKIRRMAWLSRVERLFLGHASKPQRAAYERLLACEEQGL